MLVTPSYQARAPPPCPQSRRSNRSSFRSGSERPREQFCLRGNTSEFKRFQPTQRQQRAPGQPEALESEALEEALEAEALEEALEPDALSRQQYFYLLPSTRSRPAVGSSTSTFYLLPSTFYLSEMMEA